MGMRAFLLAALCISQIGPARGTTIAAASLNGVLGGAYDSEKEAFVGSSCVAGTLVPTGAATAGFTFDTVLSQSDTARSLGLEIGGRARFSAVQLSAEAKFLKQSVSSRYSLSAVWQSEYKLPTDKLTGETLSPIGTSVRADDDKWRITCGDEYVSEITRGARLYFSIRVEFSSDEQKSEFETKFSLTGALYSANASLSQASRQLSKDVHVVVTAYQIGGDVSKVTGIFGASPTATDQYVECTLGSYDKCASVIQAALKYASDTQSGFPSQLAPGAAPGGSPIEYHTVSYTAAGIYPKHSALFDAAVREERKKLQSSFETYFELRSRTDQLLKMITAPDRLASVSAQSKLIDLNLNEIVRVAELCYQDTTSCLTSAAAMHLQEVDEKVLELPPPPEISIRIKPTTSAVLTRLASATLISKFQSDNCQSTMEIPPSGGFVTMINVPTGYPPPPGITSPAQASPPIQYPKLVTDGRLYCAAREMRDSLSTVLYINGVGLRTATFYFEDKILAEVDVSNNSSIANKKGNSSSTFVVLETVRAQPGWRDFDPYALINDSIKAGTKEGDGYEYVVIEDVFGRHQRFDLAYATWWQGSTALCQGIHGGSFRHWWWDAATDGSVKSLTSKPSAGYGGIMGAVSGANNLRTQMMSCGAPSELIDAVSDDDD